MLLLLLAFPQTLAFHPQVNPRPLIEALRATVYWGDGEEHQESSTNLFGTAGATIPESLHSQAWTASLARLAAGNSPGLELENIEQVSVSSLESSKIDIEAIVCEYDGCVSLNVPIALPRLCENPDNFESCVLENLQELDELQMKTGEQTQVFASESEMEQARDLEARLCNRDTVDHPQWWIFPKFDLNLSKYCESFLGILNEADFRSDLLQLARGQLHGTPIDRVTVVSVGPSGIILRTVQQLNLQDVPIQFPTVAQSEDELREHVLGLLEQS